VALEGRLLGGRYRIQHLLGEGGMGAVYAAEQVDLGRQVAVKVLLGERVEAGDLVRFKQEALAAARLGHPNIVQVIDFHAVPDEPALIVMEMLEGESLHARLAREARLPPERAIFIASQVLAALSVAHAAGFVHRDIKPANVFLTRTPAMSDLVKVLDFGIAKASALGGVVTAPGAVLGTPEYMAPEQALTGSGDHRIDIYALGVCLFEMLAGQRPHQAKSYDEVLAVLSGAPLPRLASLAPDVPGKLADVVDRALSRDPRHRPQRALEMLELLSAATGEVSILSAPRSSPPETDAFSLAGRSSQQAGAAAAETTVLQHDPTLLSTGTTTLLIPQPVVARAPASAPAPPVPAPPPPAPALAPYAPPFAPPVAPLPSPSPRGAMPLPVAAMAAPHADARNAAQVLERAALTSVVVSLVGTVVCCAPVAVVGVILGVNARSRAARMGVPAPVNANLAVALGLVGALASVFVVACGMLR